MCGASKAFYTFYAYYRALKWKKRYYGDGNDDTAVASTLNSPLFHFACNFTSTFSILLFQGKKNCVGLFFTDFSYNFHFKQKWSISSSIYFVAQNKSFLNFVH